MQQPHARAGKRCPHRRKAVPAPKAQHTPTANQTQRQHRWRHFKTVHCKTSTHGRHDCVSKTILNPRAISHTLDRKRQQLRRKLQRARHQERATKRQQQHVLCQGRAQRQRHMQPIRPTNVHSYGIDVVATANRQEVGGRCVVRTFSQ